MISVWRQYWHRTSIGLCQPAIAAPVIRDGSLAIINELVVQAMQPVQRDQNG